MRLRHLDALNDRRRLVAAQYTDLLSRVSGIRPPTEAAGTFHVFHQYTIRTDEKQRDKVRDHLARQGVDSMIYYPVPCHLLPVYKSSGRHLAAAEEAANVVLSLPIGPSLRPEEIERVAGALK